MGNLIGRPALYYPYVHIRSEHWLKATLLFAPVVKRIVPEHYEPEDLPNIAKYTEIEGPNGLLLQAVPSSSAAAYGAQERLLARLRESRQEIERRFNRRKAPKEDAYWIHQAKFSDELLEYLIGHKLAWPSPHSGAFGHRTWYSLHPTLGSAVMTTLGLSIAREMRYDIVTPSAEFHETLLAVEEKDIFDALLNGDKPEQIPRTAQVRNDLAQLVVSLTGINYEALQPEDIPEIQSSDNFRKFQNLVRVTARKIEADGDPEAYREQLKNEAEEIIQAWHDSRNDLSQRLRDVLFGEAVPFEALKMLFKKPDAGDLLAIGAYVVLRLFINGPWLRKEGPYQYLTEIAQAENEYVRMTFPLGLER
jgi:hypothetical protein